VDKQVRLSAAQRLVEDGDIQETENLEYALIRLNKGLLSSVGCARHGFAFALTSLLRKYPSLSTQKLITVAQKYITRGNTAKRSDKREYSLAKLVFAQVLCRAGRVRDLEAKFVSKMSAELASFAANNDLREITFRTFASLLNAVTPEMAEEVVFPAAVKLLSQKLTADHLSFAFGLAAFRAGCPGEIRDDLPQVTAAAELLKPKNAKLLTSILAESVRPSTAPHPLWAQLATALAVPAAGQVTLAALWGHVCEDTLFEAKATRLKRRLGMQAFASFVATLATTDKADVGKTVPAFLTPNFLRSLSSSLSRC
jgi:hypothetical protein